MTNSDTFHYLLSSLIQVFGTLIAVDAVFLTVRHDVAQRKFEALRGILATYIAMIERFNGIVRVGENAPRTAVAEQDAILLKSLSTPEFLVRCDRVERLLKERLNEITEQCNKANRGNDSIASFEVGIKNNTEYLAAWEQVHKPFRKTIQELADFPSMIVKIMGLPALLSVSYSLILLMGDDDKIWDFRLSIFSIFIAAIGFFLLIKWARQLFTN